MPVIEMLYLTGSIGGAERRAAYEENPELGMLLSPASWRSPWCRYYALDNDVFAHSIIGTRPDADWWEREGEAAWLAMLDKIPHQHKPMWVLLPDVVGDWEETLKRANHYRPELWKRNLIPALALQDGAERDGWRDVWRFAPDTVFIGGSTRWKWESMERIVQEFMWAGIRIHAGRVNGTTRIRRARELGVTSCDGTGLARHFDAVLPQVLRGLRDAPPQLTLF